MATRSRTKPAGKPASSRRHRVRRRGRHRPADGDARRPGAPPVVARPDRTQAQLLQGAAEEAARLLDADGAFLYLLDPETGILRFAYSAGIADPPPGPLDPRAGAARRRGDVRQGGRGAADRRHAATTPTTPRSPTPRAPTGSSTRSGSCSLVVAPLVAGDGGVRRAGHVLAPPRTRSPRPRSRLVRSLVGARGARDGQRPPDRGAGPVAAGGRAPGARRALAARARHPDLRRPRPRGRRPVHDRRGPAAARRRRRAHRHRGSGGAPAQGPAGVGRGADPRDRVAQGPRRQARGRRVRPGRRHRRDRTSAADYLTDPNLVHGKGPDTYVKSKGIHGVIATPLHGDQGPFGAITVWSTRVDAFGPDDAALLETIAGQSAVALGRARLIEELGRSREALARRAEEERTLREIGARLGDHRQRPGRPAAADRPRGGPAARRRAGPARPPRPACRAPSLWTYPEGSPFTDAPVLDAPGRPGADRPRRPRRPRGPAGRDRRLHGRPRGSSTTPRATRASRRSALHSVITAPVVGEDGLVGVFQAGHRDRDAFGEDALRLLDALAGAGRGRPRQRPPRRPARDRRRAPSSAPPTPNARCARSRGG